MNAPDSMSRANLATRIAPASLLGGTGARHIVERNLLYYRRFWMVLLSGFFEPVFYLFAAGVGLGELVGEVTGPDGEPISYVAFVAPALLAASAMNGAVYESTMNIFFKMRYQKLYDTMLATPIDPSDIAVGEVVWSQMRGLLYAIGFLVVMVASGLLSSPLGILAVPAAVLIGFAFAAVGMAATTYMRSWQDFDLVQLVTLPLFLFSATFYPLDVYPPVVQTVARLSPLYHGAELIRSLTTGYVDWTVLVHAGVLVAMGAVGVVIAARRLDVLLRS